MLQNIVAIERDGLDLCFLTITFDVPNDNFDLISAVEKVATEYCLTEEGREVYAQNCEQFNWADFDLNVPAEMCEKYGFKKVDSVLGDIEVDWDKHLVDDSKLEDLDEDKV